MLFSKAQFRDKFTASHKISYISPVLEYPVHSAHTTISLYLRECSFENKSHRCVSVFVMWIHRAALPQSVTIMSLKWEPIVVEDFDYLSFPRLNDYSFFAWWNFALHSSMKRRFSSGNKQTNTQKGSVNVM